MNISSLAADVQISHLPNPSNCSTEKDIKNFVKGFEPRTQAMSTLNLTNMNSNLPPNTGSTASISITTGSGPTAASNKNLGHVPCKFFRQGICQAGSSCPFSHNLDGTLAADKLPCKYFQKGNCKFGLKCALAHFLPDGTRVNSRGMAMNSNYNGNRRASNNYSNPSNSSIFLNGNANQSPSAQPIDISFNSCNSRSHSSANSQSQNIANFINFKAKKFGKQSELSQNFESLQFSKNTNSLSNSFNSGFNQISLSNASSQYNFREFNATTSPNFVTASSPQSNILGSSLNFLQSPPDSSDSYKLSFTQNSSLSPGYSYQEDSAIIDDEDEEYDAENGVYEEDYIPGSLVNFILTPQELQRRDSRSQSGTLLVRPIIGSSSNLFKEDSENRQVVEGDESMNDSGDGIQTTSSKKIVLKDTHPHDDVFLME